MHDERTRQNSAPAPAALEDTALALTMWRPTRSACRSLGCALLLIAVLWVPERSAADEVVQPWQGVGRSLEEIYGWPNVLFHVGALALTPSLVLAVDEPLQQDLQRDDLQSDAFGDSALIVGYILPPALPLALYGFGYAIADDEIATAGAAAIQAVLIQAVAVQTLKWLSDRAVPYEDGVSTRPPDDGLRHSESATDFNLNPLDSEQGRGWPSGHTASSFAFVSSLVAFFPDEPWLAIAGYPCAAAIAVGMIEGDYHWFSDVVAGALIGHVIGWSVGKTFRARFEAGRESARRGARERADTAITPTLSLSSDPLGVRIGGQF